MQCSWSNYLPDWISEWSKNFVMIKNLHGFVNFYTSQFITKHGMFNEYRHRFKLSNTDKCIDCQQDEISTTSNQIDTPEHLLFNCFKFADLRTQTLATNGVHLKEDL